MSPNQNLQSQNGEYILRFQCDQNLVLYGPNGSALWASNTYEGDGSVLIMQTDGNLVMYDTTGSPIWATGTYGRPNCYLTLLDDGVVAVVTADGSVATWSQGT